MQRRECGVRIVAAVFGKGRELVSTGNFLGEIDWTFINVSYVLPVKKVKNLKIVRMLERSMIHKWALTTE